MVANIANDVMEKGLELKSRDPEKARYLFLWSACLGHANGFCRLYEAQRPSSKWSKETAFAVIDSVLGRLSRSSAVEMMVETFIHIKHKQFREAHAVLDSLTVNEFPIVLILKALALKEETEDVKASGGTGFGELQTERRRLLFDAYSRRIPEGIYEYCELCKEEDSKFSSKAHIYDLAVDAGHLFAMCAKAKDFYCRRVLPDRKAATALLQKAVDAGSWTAMVTAAQIFKDNALQLEGKLVTKIELLLAASKQHYTPLLMLAKHVVQVESSNGKPLLKPEDRALLVQRLKALNDEETGEEKLHFLLSEISTDVAEKKRYRLEGLASGDLRCAKGLENFWKSTANARLLRGIFKGLQDPKQEFLSCESMYEEVWRGFRSGLLEANKKDLVKVMSKASPDLCYEVAEWLDAEDSEPALVLRMYDESLKGDSSSNIERRFYIAEHFVRKGYDKAKEHVTKLQSVYRQDKNFHALLFFCHERFRLIGTYDPLLCVQSPLMKELCTPQEWDNFWSRHSSVMDATLRETDPDSYFRLLKVSVEGGSILCAQHIAFAIVCDVWPLLGRSWERGSSDPWGLVRGPSQSTSIAFFSPRADLLDACIRLFKDCDDSALSAEGAGSMGLLFEILRTDAVKYVESQKLLEHLRRGANARDSKVAAMCNITLAFLLSPFRWSQWRCVVDADEARERLKRAALDYPSMGAWPQVLAALLWSFTPTELPDIIRKKCELTVELCSPSNKTKTEQPVETNKSAADDAIEKLKQWDRRFSLFCLRKSLSLQKAILQICSVGPGPLVEDAPQTRKECPGLPGLAYFRCRPVAITTLARGDLLDVPSFATIMSLCSLEEKKVLEDATREDSSLLSDGKKQFPYMQTYRETLIARYRYDDRESTVEAVASLLNGLESPKEVLEVLQACVAVQPSWKLWPLLSEKTVDLLKGFREQCTVLFDKIPRLSRSTWVMGPFVQLYALTSRGAEDLREFVVHTRKIDTVVSVLRHVVVVSNTVQGPLNDALENVLSTGAKAIMAKPSCNLTELFSVFSQLKSCGREVAWVKGVLREIVKREEGNEDMPIGISPRENFFDARSFFARANVNPESVRGHRLLRACPLIANAMKASKDWQNVGPVLLQKVQDERGAEQDIALVLCFVAGLVNRDKGGEPLWQSLLSACRVLSTCTERKFFQDPLLSAFVYSCKTLLEKQCITSKLPKLRDYTVSVVLQLFTAESLSAAKTCELLSALGRDSAGHCLPVYLRAKQEGVGPKAPLTPESVQGAITYAYMLTFGVGVPVDTEAALDLLEDVRLRGLESSREMKKLTVAFRQEIEDVQSRTISGPVKRMALSADIWLPQKKICLHSA